MNIRSSSPSLANLKLGLIRGFTVNVSEQRKNHYDSLGITPKSTQGDIKTAYYKLSKEYHPDLNKDDESAAEKFRNITAAYEVLGNVKSRKVYDRGLAVGAYQQGLEEETGPPEEKYPHATFYHHRNKPASRKTHTGTATNYNIDEWTKAHYSKTVNMRFKVKNNETRRKDNKVSETVDLHRTLSTISVIVILTACFLMYGVDAGKNFDNPSKVKDKPD